ncbi:hypothetical protein CSAL01_02807 [Colletotrichum salicis]|uniref:Uncharacterized protein n=1 Tax=Colletotrichum salicis TaxID=1209931 RepID=A0A135SZP8_9PEZI|nr:hypothetical protein CSAL01_02807 [Colletotrichum salicis]
MPVALFKALRQGHIELLSFTLVTLMGSILSIIVSNLWAEKVVTTNFNFITQLQTNWNLDWSDSAVNNGGAATLLNDGCTVEGNNATRNVTFAATGDKTDGWVGLFFDLDIGVPVEKQCSPCETTPDSARPDNPMSCPSIGIFFAERPFVCAQVVQQVQVGLKFTSPVGPNGEIIFKRSSLTSTPTPFESTAKNLTRDGSGLDLFPYRIQPHFDKNLTSSIPDDPVDPFFRYILSDTTGVSRDDLTNDPNQLIDVVNDLIIHQVQGAGYGHEHLSNACLRFNSDDGAKRKKYGKRHNIKRGISPDNELYTKAHSPDLAWRDDCLRTDGLHPGRSQGHSSSKSSLNSKQHGFICGK